MADYLGVLQAEAVTLAAAVPPADIPVVGASPACSSARVGRSRLIGALSTHPRTAGTWWRSRSGHWILLDEPELIVDAVRTLVAAIGVDSARS